MGLAGDIRKKIDRKSRELDELQDQREHLQKQVRELSTKMREVTAAIQAFEEVLKIAPPDDSDSGRAEPKIRPGSTVAMAREALRKHGKPMHIAKLLEAMGKEPTHESRVSLSGSLAAYVRNEQVFTRPEANTFGLVEWGEAATELESAVTVAPAPSVES